jgi:hypothetical protein
MVACPMPGVLDPLIEYAKSIGLADIAEQEVKRAYLTINQNKQLGEEIEIPTIEQFNDMLETLAIHAPGLRNAPLGAMHNGFQTSINTNPAYSTITNPITLDVQSQSSMKVSARLGRFLSLLSQNTGVPYQMVTPEQAAEITAGSVNAWKGQPAFFFQGQVYVIPGLITEKMAFHEFAHPLMRAIQLSNKALFDKLVNQVLETSMGPKLLEAAKNAYPGLAEDDPIILEEMLVMALTEAAVEKKDSAFNKFISDLLFAIRQMLRKIFGKDEKVTIEKLNENTTLEELADMLVLDKFILDLDAVSAEDVVAYYASLDEVVKDITNLPANKLVDATNEMYTVMSKHLNLIIKNKDYAAAEEIIKDKYNRNDISEIKRNLTPFQDSTTFITQEITRIMEEIRTAESHTIAFVQSLDRLLSMATKMNRAITGLIKDPNSKENISTVFYFNDIINGWESFIDNFKESLAEAQEEGYIEAENSIFELVEKIKGQIDSARISTRKVYFNGTSELIKTQLKPMQQYIDDKYKKLMDDVTRLGLSEKTRLLRMKDYWGLDEEQLKAFLSFKERVDKGEKLTGVAAQNYEKLKRLSFKKGAYLSEEKIDYLMQGNIGDAHATNSFLEAYIYNQDPIVFGFASWVKNRITDVLTTAQTKGNAFMTDVRPLLEKAGYNQSNPAAFGAKITFIDRRPARDKDGQTIDKEVRTILNPHKDYRASIAKMDKAIEDAVLKAQQSGNDTEAARLKLEKDIFMRNFFHTPYVKEYYERYRIFNKGDNDTIGAIAEMRRKDLQSRIQNLSTTVDRNSEEENKEVSEGLDVLWREYRLLHSNYNAAGQLKSPDEIAIASRLREFRDASKDFYIYEPMVSLFTDALARYEDELSRKNYPPQVVEKLRMQWMARNTNIKINDDYFKEEKRIMDKLNAIKAKLPVNVAATIKIDEAYEEMRQLLNPYRDDDMQPDGTAMSINNVAAIKAVEDKIEKAKDLLMGITGLTKLEQQELNDLFEIKSTGRLDPLEYARFTKLMDKRSRYGLSKEDKQDIMELYNELSDLRQSVPTVYYLDTINNIFGLVPIETLKKSIGSKDITVDNIDRVLDPTFYNTVIAKYPEVKKWFDENHSMKQVRDKTGGTTTRITRVRAWSVTRPKDARYYETFSFTNSKGEPETVLGVPAKQYTQRIVKDEYITKEVTMLEALEQGDPTLATVDNYGKHLPRLDAPDNRFVNQQFFDIKKNDRPLYNAILALSKYHLKFQEGNPSQSKLFLDVPRFMTSNYERNLNFLNADKKPENPISGWFRSVRNLFVGSSDDFDRGFNYEEQSMIMQGDLYDDQYAGIPIHGLSDLEVNDVSLDVVGGMLRYMLSAEKQRALIEMNPMARALQSVLHDPANYVNIQKGLSKGQSKARDITNAMQQKALWKQQYKEKSVRQKTIDNFIEREFEGITSKGAMASDADIRWLNKAAQNIMKLSAFGYFALDVPSAMKNDFSLRIQSMIEAAGGRYFNTANYMKGQLWASNTAMDVSMNLYTGKPKTHNEQLVQIFDAYQGRFEEKFGEDMSRSFAKDAVGGLSWMTSFRKWTELNSTISIFGAMMYHQTVERTINGRTERIQYMDAWETVDGQIKLKDGVDPSWGIGGDNFKAFKNKVQGVTNNLAGSFAKFDYSEADRYLLFKWIIAFKRWFIRMFLNRFQFRGSWRDPRYRFDAAVGDTVMGYHVESLRYLIRSIKGGSDYMKSISDSEKTALMKSLIDGASWLLLAMSVSMIFGFDGDDPDKFEKLRNKSGPLPFPGTPETEMDFNFMGWLSNHSLLMAMGLKQEQEQWLNGGQYLEMIKLDSVAMTNTFANYSKIGGGLLTHAMHSLFGTDDSKAYFDQREGPYVWMQEGGTDNWIEGNKAITYLSRSLGATGKSLDPAMAVTNFVKAQNWR